MANDAALVQPLNEPAPAPPVEPANPEAAPEPPAESPAKMAGGGGGIPDEVLQVPAMAALLAGSPPALSADLSAFAKRPEAQVIAANKDALMKAGMGTYRSMSGDLGVLFNRFYVSPEEIQAADKNGKLGEIAPPFDAVNQQVAQSGEAHPALQKREAPAGLRVPPSPEAPQSASAITTPGPSSEAQLNAQRARLKNLAPGGPTTGMRPGSGRLLNNILRPVL